MKNDITLVHQLRGHRLVMNTLDRVMKSWGILEVLNIFDSASGKIVDNENLITTIKISIS